MRPVFIVLLSFVYKFAFAQHPMVTSGKIERIENFPSKYVDSLNVDIWLPEGYSRDKKYAVLYMQDGQMLFDANTTWNKTAWEIDDVAGSLLKNGKIKDFIVVGVWNAGPKRHENYFPQKPFETLNQSQRDTISQRLQAKGRTESYFRPISDNYLNFIVFELKPYIDRTYSTFIDQGNTFIAGSSMGGLISLYAICEYPEVFGGAACISTHWPGVFTVENNPIPEAFLKYLKTNLPDPNSHKLYFDCGDQTLDALYPPIQQLVDKVMMDKGYTDSNWMTKFFPGEDHSEKAWSKRLDIPLLFLLKK